MFENCDAPHRGDEGVSAHCRRFHTRACYCVSRPGQASPRGTVGAGAPALLEARIIFGQRRDVALRAASQVYSPPRALADSLAGGLSSSPPFSLSFPLGLRVLPLCPSFTFPVFTVRTLWTLSVVLKTRNTFSTCKLSSLSLSSSLRRSLASSPSISAGMTTYVLYQSIFCSATHRPSACPVLGSRRLRQPEGPRVLLPVQLRRHLPDRVPLRVLQHRRLAQGRLCQRV